MSNFRNNLLKIIALTRGGDMKKYQKMEVTVNGNTEFTLPDGVIDLICVFDVSAKLRVKYESNSLGISTAYCSASLELMIWGYNAKIRSLNYMENFEDAVPDHELGITAIHRFERIEDEYVLNMNFTESENFIESLDIKASCINGDFNSNDFSITRTVSKGSILEELSGTITIYYR